MKRRRQPYWKLNRPTDCPAQKPQQRSHKKKRARRPVPREAAIAPVMAAPPDTKCDSPAKPGVGWLCDVSDSLVDDRGCLADRTERQALPCDVNLECRGPLNSTLDQRLGERVFNVLLQSPAQRAGTVAAVRARFLENPLTSLRREDHLHLPVD